MAIWAAPLAMGRHVALVNCTRQRPINSSPAAAENGVHMFSTYSTLPRWKLMVTCFLLALRQQESCLRCWCRRVGVGLPNEHARAVRKPFAERVFVVDPHLLRATATLRELLGVLLEPASVDVEQAHLGEGGALCVRRRVDGEIARRMHHAVENRPLEAASKRLGGHAHGNRVGAETRRELVLNVLRSEEHTSELQS